MSEESTKNANTENNTESQSTATPQSFGLVANSNTKAEFHLMIDVDEKGTENVRVNGNMALDVLPRVTGMILNNVLSKEYARMPFHQRRDLAHTLSLIFCNGLKVDPNAITWQKCNVQSLPRLAPIKKTRKVFISLKGLPIMSIQDAIIAEFNENGEFVTEEKVYKIEDVSYWMYMPSMISQERVNS